MDKKSLRKNKAIVIHRTGRFDNIDVEPVIIVAHFFPTTFLSNELTAHARQEGIHNVMTWKIHFLISDVRAALGHDDIVVGL